MNRFTESKTRRGRRVMGAAAVGAVAAAVSLAGAPAAFADNGYLEFSLDGKTYSASVAGPVFRDTLKYVPGASADATLWIRNNSGEPAWLSSAAVMVRSDPELNRQLGLAAGLYPELSDRSVLGTQGSCTDVAQMGMSAGEELELSLALDLSAAAPNETMNRSADIDLLFLLGSKDTAPRSACDALADAVLPPMAANSAADPSSPGSGRLSPELVAMPGTGTLPASNGIWTAGQSEDEPAPRSQGAAPAEQPQSGIVAAGINSTVEPIIRSLSGTLLITVSVLFAAAVVARVREGRYE